MSGSSHVVWDVGTVRVRWKQGASLRDPTLTFTITCEVVLSGRFEGVPKSSIFYVIPVRIICQRCNGKTNA